MTLHILPLLSVSIAPPPTTTTPRRLKIVAETQLTVFAGKEITAFEDLEYTTTDIAAALSVVCVRMGKEVRAWQATHSCVKVESLTQHCVRQARCHTRMSPGS